MCRLEYSRSPGEVVPFDRSDRSDVNLKFNFKGRVKEIKKTLTVERPQKSTPGWRETVWCSLAIFN